jgi:lipopolysaccharide cholinephosphotransferase
LTSRYGDYMKLPPEEERLGHKPYILDFGEY